MLLSQEVILAVFAPSPPFSSHVFLVSICAFLHRGSHCDGAWLVPLTRLSWLPSVHLLLLSVLPGTFPTRIYC